MSRYTGSLPVQAIVFDMDGVLCDSEDILCEAAMQMFLQEHGARVEPGDFLPFLGAGEDRYLGGVAGKYGVALRMPADKERTYALYLELIKGRLQPLPGAIDFVLASRRTGLKTAVATGADRIKMVGSLQEIGLPPEEFNVLITGDDISCPKPDPEIFRAAASQLHVEPARCVVVEDSTNGVAAARAAGCFVLGVAHSFPVEALMEAGAHIVAPTLTEAWTDAFLESLGSATG